MRRTSYTTYLRFPYLSVFLCPGHYFCLIPLLISWWCLTSDGHGRLWESGKLGWGFMNLDMVSPRGGARMAGCRWGNDGWLEDVADDCPVTCCAPLYVTRRPGLWQRPHHLMSQTCERISLFLFVFFFFFRICIEGNALNRFMCLYYRLL
jgi:hypothetical protein